MQRRLLIGKLKTIEVLNARVPRVAIGVAAEKAGLYSVQAWLTPQPREER